MKEAEFNLDACSKAYLQELESLRARVENLNRVNAEHKLKIEELTESSANLRTLIQSTDTATIFLDKKGLLQLYTPKSQEIFSFMPQDLGRDIRHFRPHFRDDRLWPDVDAVLENRVDVCRQIAVGGNRHFLRRCSPYGEITGSACGVVINYTETSTLIEVNRALEASEQRVERILQMTPNAILVLDHEHLIISANLRSQALFGALSAEKLLGVRFEALLAPSPDVNAFFGRLATEKEIDSFDVELPGHTVSGKPLLLEISVGGFRTDSGVSRVLVLTDIGPLRAAEAAQKAALQEAMTLARSKSNFLANMSHEFRTPLNGVLGLAHVGLLPSTLGDRDKTRECLTQILESGGRLREIVEEVLDFSRLEIGQLALHESSCSPAIILKECVEGFRDRCERKGLALHSEASPEFEALRIGADPARLRQVCNVLLSNAVKFTTRGSVTVRADVGIDGLRIDVSDTGIGMSPLTLKRLFQPFMQADDSLTRQYEGAGLGLAISADLAALMGGRVSVESEVGAGSTFSLQLPVRPLPAGGEPDPEGARSVDASHSEFAGVRVLVAEDDPINQSVIEHLLKELGASVRVFDGGTPLLNYCRKNGPDCADLILMDLSMPGMDGYATTIALKALAVHADIPVIAISAHVYDEVRQRCRTAGIVDHIGKPYDFQQVVKTIRRNLSEKAGLAKS
ncbi:MAG: hypothetical protein RLZZ200_77 [Pseudomonadota bacterium]